MRGPQLHHKNQRRGPSRRVRPVLYIKMAVAPTKMQPSYAASHVLQVTKLHHTHTWLRLQAPCAARTGAGARGYSRSRRTECAKTAALPGGAHRAACLCRQGLTRTGAGR